MGAARRRAPGVTHALMATSNAQASPRAAPQHLLHRLGSDAERLPERERVIGERQVAREQRVVDELHGLPGADRPYVEHRIPECLEHRSTPLGGLLVTSDRDRQLTSQRDLPTAAHRHVEHDDAALRRCLCKLTAGRRRDRRVNGDDGARSAAGEHSVLAFEHLTHVVVGPHADADDIATRRQIRRALRGLDVRARKGSSASGRRAQSTVGNPASMIRWTIPPPISPRPMNPNSRHGSVGGCQTRRHLVRRIRPRTGRATPSRDHAGVDVGRLRSQRADRGLLLAGSRRTGPSCRSGRRSAT